MFRLQLVALPNRVGTWDDQRISPALIGLPFLPPSSSSRSSTSAAYSSLSPNDSRSLSLLECDEEEQDQTKVFSLGPRPPSLTSEQKRRFRSFLLDLGLRKNIVEEEPVPVSLHAGSDVAGQKEQLKADACEPKLILVHSAVFEF
jgi:hypothetical protein